MNNREYFASINGASGFTGTFIVYYMIKLLIEHNNNEKILLLGRSKDRIINGIKERLNCDINNDLKLEYDNIEKYFDIIECDVKNYDDLKLNLSKSYICINCAGPFKLLGENVVKACCEVKTNYVDISGEPSFIESMELLYNDKAKESNIFIVSAVGFDSIPSEVSTSYIVDQVIKENPVEAIPCHVELYLESSMSQGSANFATYESLVYGFKTAQTDLKNIRKELKNKREIKKIKFDERIEKLNRHTSNLGTYIKDINKTVIPFPGADASIILRSQYELAHLGLNEKNDENNFPKPIQPALYFVLPSLKSKIGFTLFGLAVSTLPKNFLLKQGIASKVSFGIFKDKGNTPSDDERKNIFTFDVFCKGVLKSDLENASSTNKIKPKLMKRLKVQGTDVGYSGTARIAVSVVEACENYLTGKTKLPEYKQGVKTSAILLRDTNIVEILKKNNAMTIEEIEI